MITDYRTECTKIVDVKWCTKLCSFKNQVNIYFIAVPVTYAWRDELEKKTHMAISRAMGHPPPSRGGVKTRSGLRTQQHEGGQFDHIHDDQVSTHGLSVNLHGDTHFHVRM